MGQRLSDSTVQQVKQFSGIVEFIQQYVGLTRRGRNYIGLCPFHSEKTPSFTVSPEKRIFHCFGCHESGDLISFAEKIDTLTFYESIELIAQFAGISVEYDEVTASSKRQNKTVETMLQCLKVAHDFFVTQLSGAQQVLGYVQSRGVSAELIDGFKLGYGAGSDDFLAFMRQQGVDEGVLVSSGLFSKGKLFSRFHRRLLFPIYDFQNRLVGFGGRILDKADNTAKYVNSDESIIFNKRRLLYGMNMAKRAIKEKGYVVLVEGYMDVILCHQYGFKHVVACMGTSLTQEQVQLIKRVTNSVYLMLDQDKAGLLAMERSMAVLTEMNVEVHVVYLPEKDAADFLLAYGKEKLELCFKEAVPRLKFMYETLKKQYDLTQIEQVSRCVQEVCQMLSSVEDDIIRSYYISLMSRELSVDDETIMAILNQIMYTGTQLPYYHVLETKKEKDKLAQAEDGILSTICTNLDLRNRMRELTTALFVNDTNKTLCEAILQSTYSDSHLLDDLNPEFHQPISQLLLHNSGSLPKKALLELFSDCVRVLENAKKEQEKERLKQAIKESELNGNEEEVLLLMQSLSQIQKGGN